VGTTLGVTGVATFAAGTVSLPALTTTGDTNTGIYYPAADTFAVTTGGTERFRSHSFGFGVGLTPINGNGKFQVLGGDGYDGQFTLTAQLSDVTGSAAKGVLIGYNNTTNNGIISAAYGNGTEGLQFWTHNNSTWGPRMTLEATGNLAFPTGKGIDFSAVTGGTGTATGNVLNDYEEGTWTPVIKFGATTATQNATKATYTKIGRQVTCFVETYVTNLNGGTGNFEMSGLPFTSLAMRCAQGDFYFEFMGASFPEGDKQAFINDSSTAFNIRYFTGASATSSALIDTNFTTSSYVYAKIVYFV